MAAIASDLFNSILTDKLYPICTTASCTAVKSGTFGDFLSLSDFVYLARSSNLMSEKAEKNGIENQDKTLYAHELVPQS
jgi:hypothetical protein